ncbi:hypothetical protein D3C87_1700060 [compost metagenome]
MRFRKSITSESLQLFKDSFRKFDRIAFSYHTINELLLILVNSPLKFKSSHTPSQAIRFSRCKTSCNNGNLHRLLLKQRYPERSPQNLLQLRRRVNNRFFSIPPSQVRMHHISLNWPRTNNCNLNHQVIKFSWF